MKIHSARFSKQVKHNESFHSSLCSSFTDHYFDWKITCLFYCAYHLIQAFGSLRNVKIGDRHKDILWNLNPKNPNRPTPFKSKAFDAYDMLFEYSQSARYSGITDFETWQSIKQTDHKHALSLYQYLKTYIKAEGVEI